VRTKHYGLANQWLGSWYPVSTSEVALILEDDNYVSPKFFLWVKEALKAYFNNPASFDPRVYGISLQNQHMIAGRYPTKPAELLSPHVTLYKYQLPSTWGPIFFGGHWASFLSWFAAKSLNPTFQPLVSNLITNTWFLARGGGRSVWSSWFIRFAAEKGLYMLYTNFPDGEALVVNGRDAGKLVVCLFVVFFVSSFVSAPVLCSSLSFGGFSGVNYHKTKGPNSLMVANLTGKMEFPPNNELPIYDFHFNRIVESPVILDGRGLYADTYNVVTV